jgi:Na+-transporting methylmalonyl-CoA/oxaloacetate decarboxylase gamma subunit
LLTFFLVGLVTLIVAGVLLSVVGMAMGLASFLLFKVAPLLLVGWVVVKAIEETRGIGKLSDTDRKWLDAE